MLVSDLSVKLPEDQIGLDDGLSAVVGLDSVKLSELRGLCERQFDVRISDEDYVPSNFGSIRRIANLVEWLHAASCAAISPVA
jgi:acyl carrier protein